jgi:ABC-2 type transport system ATP-binding protein
MWILRVRNMADDLVIDVKGLNKSFADKHVVKDVNLRVKRGEIFGFLGPNGSGKTTTLRMICGLLTPDSGTGHCLGYDILRDATQIKMRVGYMTQNFSLYEDMTVYENMRFVGKVYQMDRLEERIKQTLEQLSFGSRAKQLAGSMSGGWKQRLALACCLLHDPQVLLLDEPTAGVDPKARRDFWDQIHVMANQGITTLVTTHYMDEAERCTRLAYIAYGTLLAEGKMHEIIDQSALYAWAVSGEGLGALALKLKVLPDVDEVAVFGEVLHVTGYDKARLAQAIAPYRTEALRWKEIKPSIEDVFISLVGKSEDNF